MFPACCFCQRIITKQKLINHRKISIKAIHLKCSNQKNKSVSCSICNTIILRLDNFVFALNIIFLIIQILDITMIMTKC